jgi:transposase-like protein
MHSLEASNLKGIAYGLSKLCLKKICVNKKKLTSLGYETFKCRDCSREFNERSATAFNHTQYPTDVIMLTVFYYYRFKVSLTDVVVLMLMRGFHMSHQAVHNWVQQFGTSLRIKLRNRRFGQCGDRWHVDATYIRIEGRWCYLYRAIDKEGNLIDVYVSDVRDQEAAEIFFRQAATTCGVYPYCITTDKEPALYKAIENTFSDYTDHRDNTFMNNHIEQDHRGIKSRVKVMKGFKDIFKALVFCTVFEEIRQFFRMKNKTRAESRSLFSPKFQELNVIFAN